MPTISVVIPAYNAARFIGDALASIRAQTLRDIDVIVVDDGSTDSTVAKVQGFAPSLDITIIRQPNAGPAAARNHGVRRARGRFCAFLDSDDVMLPERLESQLALFQAHPSLGLVHTDLMTFDDRGIIHRTRHAFSNPCGGAVLDRLLIDNFITTSTVMAPKERLIEAGLFNEKRRVSEDFELWLRMASRWTIGFVDRPLVQYRRRPGSLSADKLLTARCALDVVENFWSEHPELQRRESKVYRHSLAHHLAFAGAAALDQRRHGTALRYLSRALRYDPSRWTSWRYLAKCLAAPARRSARGGTLATRPETA
jgi:glycosyltransferase involved in cell wall biosynthesis